MSKTPQDVLRQIKDNGIEFIDLKFSDLHGKWQHLTVCSDMVDEDSFQEGLAFDGSSIRGWKAINKSDMSMIPDPNTAWEDPFYRHKTLSMICSIGDPRTEGCQPYDRCPRSLAQRALNYLNSTGVADTAFFGPEPEFFIFDDVRYNSSEGGAFYSVDTIEAPWNTGRLEEGGNLAYKIQLKEGYFPVSPNDTAQDIRTEMLSTMGSLGVPIEKHHHEVAGAGQHELGMKFAQLIEAADNVMIYKYVVRNVAKKYGKTATFMPKPVFNDNGTGMHVHQSLWKDNQPLFFGQGTYAELSQTARWYIGGILKHAPAFLAFTNPTTNSYKRLVPGFEAPVNLVYSLGNRSAAVRIPLTSGPKAKRLEFRSGDALANPYLAFSAMMMAGIDGIKNQIDPGQGCDEDLFEMSAEELAKINTVPCSLDAALDALDADRAFLTEGGVFTDDFIDNWKTIKMEEVQELRQRPHPYEFTMYYDA
ncbi:MAG: type I glutamate--ammonia ligase [Cyanobium sp. NAT70]|nr:type I glutamate--ammonia ligase [Cyanobium sp. NAT70]